MRSLLLVVALLPLSMGEGIHTMCHAEFDIRQAAEEKCLAVMVYGEARGEDKTGMQAVAYTALNRAVKSTVCSVILAPNQYSIFNNNPALRNAAKSSHTKPVQKNSIDEDSWEQAVTVAKDVMNREVKDPTNGATHYIAPKLMSIKKYHYPKWSKTFKLTAVIGNHKFYKPVDKTTVTAL
jgi:spore germination cell wall hydrolase CwlJ-like protein